MPRLNSSFEMKFTTNDRKKLDRVLPFLEGIERLASNEVKKKATKCLAALKELRAEMPGESAG